MAADAPDAPDTPVMPRPAASLVLLRDAAGPRPRVLMGRRPETARFMPGIHVFPGGAVDPGDAATAEALLGPAVARPPITRTAEPREAAALAWAALRETWEETNVLIGRAEPSAAGEAPAAHDSLAAAYARAGLAPSAGLVAYIARAITPPFMPMRFDTRFFLARAEDAHGTPRASGELPEVLWLDVDAVLADDTVRGVSKFVLRHALELLAAGTDLADGTRPVPRMMYQDGTRRIDME